MRVAPFFLGLAAAAALTAEAGACRYRNFNYATEPYMAEFVRSAHSIELATVSNIDVLPVAEQDFGMRIQTHSYTFDIVETLFGPSSDQFTFAAAAPFPDNEPETCQGITSSAERARILPCLIFDRTQASRDAGRQTAASGRRDWILFNSIYPSYHDGMGGVPDPRGGSCGFSQSFEVGATYLVFRDEAGEIIRSHGLNLQMITRSDDRWMESVRYFLNHPEADWLPAQSAQDVLTRFDHAAIVRMDYCPGSIEADEPDLFDPIADIERLVRGSDDDFVPTIYFEYEFDEAALEFTDYSPGVRYLFVEQRNAPPRGSLMPLVAPLPIRDGMVDLSGIPSQHAVEPSQVPLADVIAWLSDAPENEPPQ